MQEIILKDEKCGTGKLGNVMKSITVVYGKKLRFEVRNRHENQQANRGENC